jgi:hypothetical protein
MCSGCSGNYSGDYYDDGEYIAKNDTGLPEEITGPEHGAVSQETNADPLTSHLGNGGFRELADSTIETPTLENDWQVYVSAEQIIEIHFLHSRFEDAIAVGMQRPAQSNQPTGNEPQGQHSGRLSANNYQTPSRQGFLEVEGYRIRLMQIGLGAVAAAILAAWRILR